MLTVNLFGGSGNGKTTLAHLVTARMKMQHPEISTEWVGEAAKDFVLDGQASAMRDRIYLLGQQSYRVSRLQGKARVVVSDGPVLLNHVYGKREGWPQCYLDLCLHAHRMGESLNFLVRRSGGVQWECRGRRETDVESQEIHQAIKDTLSELSVPFVEVQSCMSDAELIASSIAERCSIGPALD